VIGPVGARRAIALLVIGDAVLGGLFVGVLLRPSDEGERPRRAVTSTTVASPAAAPEPGVLERAPDGPARPTESSPPVPSTTAATTTTPLPSPTTVPSTGPRVADVTTTVPDTTPSTTQAPSTTAPPPVEVDG
jgi:hypothetical protein